MANERIFIYESIKVLLRILHQNNLISHTSTSYQKPQYLHL